MDKRASNSAKSFTPIRPILDQAFYKIDKAQEDPATRVDLESGYSLINHLLIGNDQPRFSIISVPKIHWSTSLGASIAVKIARYYDRAIGYFSLSTSGTYLASQMLCLEAKIDYHNMMAGKLPREQWPALSSAAGQIADSSIYIDDGNFLSVKAICKNLQNLTKKSKIDIVIIDNLQLVSYKSFHRNKNRSYQKICKDLRTLAIELNVSILLLSHFSGDNNLNSFDEGNEFGSLPFLQDYRGMPDTILYLKPGQHEGKVRLFDLHISYNREGPTGIIKLMQIHDGGGFLEYYNKNHQRRARKKEEKANQ